MMYLGFNPACHLKKKYQEVVDRPVLTSCLECKESFDQNMKSMTESYNNFRKNPNR